MTLSAALLLATQREKHAFIHGLRDGFLIIIHLIGRLLGGHHVLYHHSAGDAYVLGFLLGIILFVVIISWIVRILT
jgi:hypothetical protein